MRGGARARARGITLIETLVVVSIAALLAAGVLFGVGAPQRARLRGSAAMVASAVRVAYQHATATSRPTRLVFDFDARTVSLEDTSGRMLLERGDAAGGAEGTTELEREAQAEAQAILKGPRAPRPSFSPARALGLEGDGEGTTRTLESGVQLAQIEVEHAEEPVDAGRVYLYFWPGGQTERAAIQLRIGRSDEERDHLTLLVSPLTGRVEVKAGRHEMPRPRDEEEASERDDTGGT